MKVLLLTWDGGGNFPPQRTMVRALVRRGHQVHVVAHESLRDRAVADGATFSTVQGVAPYDSRDPLPPEWELFYTREAVFFAQGFGTSLVAETELFQPDLLLIDAMLVFGLNSAHWLKLPAVVLWSSLYGPLAGGPISQFIDERAYGFGGEHQSLTAKLDAVQVSTYRPFDYEGPFFGPIFHVGPLRANVYRGPSIRLAHEPPLVVVSLSTTFQDQGLALQRICDAMQGQDLEAIVTTGPAVPRGTSSMGNVTVCQWADHDVLLASAELLVTHAGHGTVAAGLTYGVPMLCLPMGRDQPLVAQRVLDLGLGRVLSPDAPIELLSLVISDMLCDVEMHRRCRDFAASLEGHPGLPEAIEQLEFIGKGAG